MKTVHFTEPMGASRLRVNVDCALTEQCSLPTKRVIPPFVAITTSEHDVFPTVEVL